MILGRSTDFSSFYSYFKLQLYSERDVRVMLSVLQQLWDLGESAGWLQYLNQTPLPGTPVGKTALILTAFGDSEVHLNGKLRVLLLLLLVPLVPLLPLLLLLT